MSTFNRGLSELDLTDDFDVDMTKKVIVVGNSEVGKTSLINRFVKATFTNCATTLLAEFRDKRLFLEGFCQDVTFHIWDTPGSEELRSLSLPCYKGAAGCIVVFSTCDRSSLNAVPNWVDRVRGECGDGVIIVLVQTKIDLVEPTAAEVTREDADEIARKLDLSLFCVSSKEDVAVATPFEHLGLRFCGHEKEAEEQFRTGMIAKGGMRWDLPNDEAATSRSEQKRVDVVPIANTQDFTDAKEEAVSERKLLEKLLNTEESCKPEEPLSAFSQISLRLHTTQACCEKYAGHLVFATTAALAFLWLYRRSKSGFQ